MLVLLPAMLLPACTQPPPPGVRSEFLAMGTLASINVAEPMTPEVSAVVDEARELMERLGREWYPWTADGSGELASLNAALARGDSRIISAELADLLREAQRLTAASGRRFEPGVGTLVELWGFTQGVPETPHWPDTAQLATWRAHPASIADLTIDGLEAMTQNAALKLDLGAIAKGRVVDLAAERLLAAGIRNALISAGGNVKALGTNEGRPWRVAIRQARDGDEAIGWVELQDQESIDTSGDYERFATLMDGRRIHHLLDPRSGEPATETAAITVLADNGTVADAAATAIFVAGRREWRQVAAALGVHDVLRVDASGHVETTPTMAQRITWLPGKP